MEFNGDEVPSEVNKKEINEFNSADSSQSVETDSAAKEESEVSSSEDDEDDDSLDENNSFSESDQSQVVVYDPLTMGAGEIVHAHGPLSSQTPTFSRKDPKFFLPSVAKFTVQCADCFKWRLIPTKEKYEEIRENIADKPFYCEAASWWRPGVSCDDPGDVKQDNSMVWAIDKPSIARPPPGWQRILRAKSEGSFRFTDVYYEAPSGKQFRSLIEIQTYLAEIPELAAGISMSQFSFLIPEPLEKDYVKRRPSGMKSSGPQDSGEGRTDDLHNGQPEPCPSSYESPPDSFSDQSPKKRAKKLQAEDNASLS